MRITEIHPASAAVDSPAPCCSCAAAFPGAASGARAPADFSLSLSHVSAPRERENLRDEDFHILQSASSYVDTVIGCERAVFIEENRGGLFFIYMIEREFGSRESTCKIVIKKTNIFFFIK